ncbi:MAG: FTR1 family iron permease [Dehalococcoidia bacterium]|nr:FTR1 family iron permease [Dehalococcoidia bacterium]
MIRPFGKFKLVVVFSALFVVSLFAASFFAPHIASAVGPQDDLAAANAIVKQAITAAQAGDFAKASQEYKSYENMWFDIEDGIRETSRESYRLIEHHMGAANAALSNTTPDKAVILTALNNLDIEQARFISGNLPTPQPTGTPSTDKRTISTLLSQLAATYSAVKAGDYASASVQFDTFKNTWLDVEGEIKTRSDFVYRNTENDVARVSTALSSRSPDAASLLDGMINHIKPYENAGGYRPFDATIIVLREGLEAMLVVVALLAFVKKSGNADKSKWIWSGAVSGILLSVALGVFIHLLFKEAFPGANRELIEGITGIFAAGMLLYVSYWLHSKTSLGAWHRFINDKTTAALAKGSLIGLAFLSFLAVFREGGETVLFLLGMAGNITTGDLALGLGIGFGSLAVAGIVLIKIGARIPMRPFFAVASVLTFYLCFKFVGTGIHALQIADVISARTADFLPESDTLGLFPTWQTTLPQIGLLIAAVSVVLIGRFHKKRLVLEPAPGQK